MQHHDNAAAEIGIQADGRLIIGSRVFQIAAIQSQTGMIDPGMMNARAVIETPIIDSSYEPTGKFEKRGTRWTKFEELSGRELSTASQSSPVYSHKATFNVRGMKVIVNLTERPHGTDHYED